MIENQLRTASRALDRARATPRGGRPALVCLPPFVTPITILAQGVQK